jgi:predicted  nucleic acid-binding Zn-ribbon protein
MADMNEIKAKFNKLQTEVTQLNNKKIGMESEIKTIDADMKELSDKLLAKSGMTTLEDALTYFKEQHNLLEEKKEKISKELDDYLNIDDGVKADYSLG